MLLFCHFDVVFSSSRRFIVIDHSSSHRRFKCVRFPGYTQATPLAGERSPENGQKNFNAQWKNHTFLNEHKMKQYNISMEMADLYKFSKN